MAARPVTVDAINLVLREARVCFCQLECIHDLLNFDPNRENEEWRRNMEANIAMIFRDIMSYLYSVLDHIFFFLYCHFQNNGKVSFANAVFKIKQPMEQSLKFSRSPDQEVKCKKDRNDWVEKQCRKIFGDKYYQNKDLNSNLENLREFQKALLSIQAIQEVDEHGAVVNSTQIAGPKLMHAHKIEHRQDPALAGIDHPADGDLKFNPICEFEEIQSVEELDNWNVATTFNLLHFFRNFTSHRTLIECPTKPGYLNLYTMGFRPGEDGQKSSDEIFIAKGNWILVPELSHLRDEKRKGPVTFYRLPLLKVCSQMFTLVKTQKSNLLRIVGIESALDVSDDIIKGVNGKMKVNGRVVKWYEAREWYEARTFVSLVDTKGKAHRSKIYIIFTALAVVVIGLWLTKMWTKT